MPIKIAERLKPYCHCPGTYVLLPGSTLRLQIFPTRLHVDDLSVSAPKRLVAIDFCLKGPLDGFTVLQDLEKGQVRVWGKNNEGHFRYTLAASAVGKGLTLAFEKLPQKKMDFVSEGDWKTAEKRVEEKGIISFGPISQESCMPFAIPAMDRLSLGNNKAQDWELIRRRRDFREIFPVWHRLGQLIPGSFSSHHSGTAALLEDCRQAALKNSPEFILQQFERLFLSGFEGILSPRLLDSEHQGFSLPEIDPLATPLILLSLGSQLIRSLFFQEEGQKLTLLPALPPQFHCGRLIQIPCEGGILNFEWTKKVLRRVIFQATQSQVKAFSFSQGEKRCRLRLARHEKGHRYTDGQTLETSAGQNYWFDNFEG